MARATEPALSAGEFDLIACIRRRAAARPDVALGIGDDAALLVPPAGCQLAVSMDTLNAGVHFPPCTAPSDIGWKALAVNLSDLAAMGAAPAWCTLSLSLPAAEPAWVDAFLDGFLELAGLHDVALVGGDTTRGPLSVCVAVHGFVEPHMALRRDGARGDDDIWVSGTLGDAAGGLRIVQGGDAAPEALQAPHPSAPAVLRSRLDRPVPRVELGRALRGHAHAAIDVSDGLLADLGHICAASGLGAEVDVAGLPASIALRECFGVDAYRGFQCSGGDDYELCFTAPAASRSAVIAAAQAARTPVARIGRMTAGLGIRALTATGEPWRPMRTGFDHFR